MQTIASPSQSKQSNSPPASPPGALPPVYTTGSFFQLFMVCAFPIHLWFLLMAFRDFGWVGLRTVVWDAIGLVSYALFVALIETIVVFFVTLLLGFLLPRRWEVRRRIALLGTLALIVSSWSILAEAFGLYGGPVPAWLMTFLRGLEHPLRLLWLFAFILALLSISLPVLWLIKQPGATSAVVSFFDRLVILSSLYLLLDVAAIAIILTRNISAQAGAT